MDTLEKYNEKNFEDIKHIDEYGNEYWYARELQVALDYKKWQKFENVIENAKLLVRTVIMQYRIILPKWVK